MATLLKTSKYDPVRTKALQLEEGIRGGAFTSNGSDYTYVLWAETSKDMSEVANKTFRFPAFLKTNTLVIKDWGFSKTKKVKRSKGPIVELTGTPVFIEVVD